MDDRFYTRPPPESMDTETGQSKRKEKNDMRAWKFWTGAELLLTLADSNPFPLAVKRAEYVIQHPEKPELLPVKTAGDWEDLTEEADNAHSVCSCVFAWLVREDLFISNYSQTQSFQRRLQDSWLLFHSSAPAFLCASLPALKLDPSTCVLVYVKRSRQS